MGCEVHSIEFHGSWYFYIGIRGLRVVCNGSHESTVLLIGLRVSDATCIGSQQSIRLCLYAFTSGEHSFLTSVAYNLVPPDYNADVFLLMQCLILQTTSPFNIATLAKYIQSPLTCLYGNTSKRRLISTFQKNPTVVASIQSLPCE